MPKTYARIQNLYLTAAEWANTNPILREGEIGVESDTNKQKFGDGSTFWNDLEYTPGSYQGPTGPIGPIGVTGPTGVQGISAYEVAVSEGYTGTESEWLASLAEAATLTASGHADAAAASESAASASEIAAAASESAAAISAAEAEASAISAAEDASIAQNAAQSVLSAYFF